MQTIREKIEARSVPEPMSGCWIWLGALTGAGYGELRHQGEPVLAHRLSFEAFVGPIPDGKLVRHRCDARFCVNPEHLVAGTKQDNADDMVRRGRYGAPRLTGAKITAAEAAAIRVDAANGVPHAELAARSGLDRSQISRIAAGKAWS